MKIVRVTASWCMSCLVMKKVWKNVFQNYPDIKIVDYDYDFDSEQIQTYHIGKILPELIVFDDGVEVTRIIGEKSKKQMLEILEGLHEEY